MGTNRGAPGHPKGTNLGAPGHTKGTNRGAPGHPMGPDRATFDAAGLLRRVRRRADISQRELAQRAGVGHATVGRVEAASHPVSLSTFDTLVRAAGFRLAVLDTDGHELAPMRDDAIRNNGNSRYPAHLDPRLTSWVQRAGSGQHHCRPLRKLSIERRPKRDIRRPTAGIPFDHPGPDDIRRFAEHERAEAKRLDALRPPRPVLPPQPECACGPECERECVPACPCQCEPA